MSDYKCEACGKYRKPEQREFAVGDSVQFATTVEYPSGRVKATTREGVVLERDAEDADDVCLKVKVKRSKRWIWVREKHCLPIGAPGPLTYALLGVCSCGGGQ